MRGAYSKVRKYITKGPQKQLEVTKNELDRLAIKLN